MTFNLLQGIFRLVKFSANVTALQTPEEAHIEVKVKDTSKICFLLK